MLFVRVRLRPYWNGIAISGFASFGRRFFFFKRSRCVTPRLCSYLSLGTSRLSRRMSTKRRPEHRNLRLSRRDFGCRLMTNAPRRRLLHCEPLDRNHPTMDSRRHHAYTGHLQRCVQLWYRIIYVSLVHFRACSLSKETAIVRAHIEQPTL